MPILSARMCSLDTVLMPGLYILRTHAHMQLLKSATHLALPDLPKPTIAKVIVTHIPKEGEGTTKEYTEETLNAPKQLPYDRKLNCVVEGTDLNEELMFACLQKWSSSSGSAVHRDTMK